MDFRTQLGIREFYRFTGPPENWLTAVKFMTWGMVDWRLEQWKKIQPGDIFFFHSTGGNSLFTNSKPCIVGLGVVGGSFRKKENYLWIQEFLEKENKWPLLVPFSEIYLFGELPELSSWDSQSLSNQNSTNRAIKTLVENGIPLRELPGFPHMGTFSGVRESVAESILNNSKNLHLYCNYEDELTRESSRATELNPVNSSDETLRYAETLKMFDCIQPRIVNTIRKSSQVDSRLLSRAEQGHASIINQLISVFKKNGYVTRSNRFVDLFAHKEDRCVLVEAKTIDNNNFRRQARTGLAQLFEYEYFEVRRFERDKGLSFTDRKRLLVTSQAPSDQSYVSFLNDCNVGLGYLDNSELRFAGNDLGMSYLHGGATK